MHKILCQSCGAYIGFDIEKGTNEDGTLSVEYCLNCYQNGKFINEDTTLEKMIVQSIKRAIKNNQDVEKAKKLYIKFIPTFNRWNKTKLNEKKLEKLLKEEINK